MTQPLEQDPVQVAAAEWFVQLQAKDVSEETSLECLRWLSADPRHAEAFARMAAVWDEPWESLQTPRKKSTRRVPLLLAASVAALAAGVVAWFSYSGGVEENIRTAVGENRTLALSDGSQVTLGGGTILNTSFTDRTRRMTLLRGEAFFTVAKDKARPFVVEAGDATITAVGTEFNVRRAPDRTVIAVVEGRVRVSTVSLPSPMTWVRAASPQHAPLRLDAGQQAIVDQDGVQSTSRLADPSTATAWQSGQFAFREEPLRNVLEDVNRYSVKPIVIDDASGNADIGDILISGTVLSDSVPGWIASLEGAFDLQAREEAQRIVLSRRP